MTEDSTEVAPHSGVDSTRTAKAQGAPRRRARSGVFLQAHGGNPCFYMIALELLTASAFGSIRDVLDSTAFHVARSLALVLAVVFWLGLAFWVYRDARRRTDDPLQVGTATLLGLVVPYIGPVIYLLFRPAETLAEERARELELRALEKQVGARGVHCPICRAEVEPDFLVCPVCTTQLKHACVACSAALEPSWLACPYCTAPAIRGVPGPVAPELHAELLDAARSAEVADLGGSTDEAAVV